MHSRQPLIETYRDYLPMTEGTPVITLGEGNTPLVKAINLPQQLGFPKLNLYFKLEGLNPTGSFKDRGMTLAISKAVEEGCRGVICASTGNTSASAAAFATKAGLPCFVILPAGHVAVGKLSQAILYGAKVIPIEGNFDQALNLVKDIAADCHLTIVNSINNYRLEGQKTAAFEIIEQLGNPPDYLFIPVGNAGNISAYWRGFKLWKNMGKAKTAPRMCGFEAAGAAAIVLKRPIAEPDTKATAIRIGNPASWKEAEKAALESDGWIDSVTDDEIMDAYKLIARAEGIFCEPSSAAGLAGLIKHLKAGAVLTDSTVVSVLTGNGLKDPNAAMSAIRVDLNAIEPTIEKVKQAIGI